MPEPQFTFRPLAPADLPLLTEWLGRPHVRAWWHCEGGVPKLAAVRREFEPCVEDASTVRPHIVLLDGEPFGFIQSYVALGSGDGWWEDETDPGVRGIDQFIADESRLGQGLGSRMVRAFAKRLLAEPGVTQVQADPAPANARAIACYRRAGFEAVREIVTPDGPALLMLMRADNAEPAG